MINYCIIGDNWGFKIFRILKNLNKQVFLFQTNKKRGSKKYFVDLKKFILKKKISFIWIATPPLNRFKLLNFCINQNLNLIIEKPIILKKNEFKILDRKLKIKKKYCFIHFEYLFLKKLKNFSNKNIKKIDMHFHHSKVNRHKIDPYLNNGTHLMSLKKKYFNKVKNISYYVSEGNKNLRQINIFKNKRIKINFTYNKEKIIQRFIFYIEDIFSKQKINEYNLKFGYDCTEKIKLILKRN